MGSAWFTFHGAEHTRFGHSLGTLFIAKKMISHLSNNFPEINKLKVDILTCALIHDIGHGPFSHTAEKLTNIAHEDWTKRILTSESEINSVLKNYDVSLPSRLIKLFEYKTNPVYLSQIISSYIDCDRLDYLQRDSFFVGVPYGLIGSDRIIASLEIDEASKNLVVNEHIGLDPIIHYLHARYSMYLQIYQHKKNLVCDFLLRKIINRAKEALPKNISNALYEWLNVEGKTIEKIKVDSFLQIDDYSLTTYIQNWANDSGVDKILKDLSNSFISRKLFKALELRKEVNEDKINEVLEKIKPIATNKGLDSNYYFGIEQSGTKPYEPYKLSEHKTNKAILVKQKNDSLKELSEVSGLVKALSQENITKTCLVFSPNLEDEITNIKGLQELFK